MEHLPALGTSKSASAEPRETKPRPDRGPRWSHLAPKGEQCGSPPIPPPTTAGDGGAQRRYTAPPGASG